MSQWDLGAYATSLVLLQLVQEGFAVDEVERFLTSSPLFSLGSLTVEDPDARTPARRRDANIAALERLTETCCSTAERRILRGYSGWGGLSMNDLPRTLGAVRPEELLATYYTPTRLCFDLSVALRPKVLRLHIEHGRQLDALEPSAGVGRFMWPWAVDERLGVLNWTAYEPDPLSSRILGKLTRANVIADVFERHDWQQAYDLLLTNPPYGVRDQASVDPKGKEYRAAQDYFLEKGLAVLRPFGLGVLLVPSGLMSGTSPNARKRRESLVSQARLLTAVRLPNNLFPGANLMVDLIVLRKREGVGGDDDDRAIVAGQWFDVHGDLVLGTLGTGKYGAPAVQGDYTGLPNNLWRRADLAVQARPVVAIEASERVEATEFARLERRLKAMRDAGVWDGLQEFLEDVDAWKARWPKARTDAEALRLQATDLAGREVLTVDAPTRDDFGGLARRRIRHDGLVTAVQVAADNNALGGRATPEGVEAQLLRDRWGLALELGGIGEQAREGRFLIEPELFWAGDLWRHVDALGNSSDARVQALLAEVQRQIGAVTFEQIPVPSARATWVPSTVIAAWIQDELNLQQAPTLLRSRELVSLDPVADKLVGWINGDLRAWKPEPENQEDEDRALANSWGRFWPALPRNLRDLAAERYNRTFKGLKPAAPRRPQRLARLAVELLPHQHDVLQQIGRRGLVALDVGLGKTFTGCALLARARQEGWSRRAAIVVPPSLIANWIRELRRALPDMSYALIGYNVTRNGRLTADTGTDRRAKWLDLRSGAVDFVLCSETAFLRMGLPVEYVLAEVEHPFLDDAALQMASGRRRTERQTVVGEAIRRDHLKAMMAPVHEPDPVLWTDIQPGLLIVDEAHHMRKSIAPAELLGGVPDYVGNTDTSRTAFQLWLRCLVAEHAYLLTATPVVNGPCELATLLTACDPNVFRRFGVDSMAAWMTTFLRIEYRQRETMAGATVRPACTGLDNLDSLRAVTSGISIWRSARETLGTRGPDNPGGLPETVSRTQEVDADGATREATTEVIDFIEKAVDGGRFDRIAAYLTALRKIAEHPSLYLQGERTDDGRLPAEELDLPRPLETSKFAAILENIRAQPGCGHLVFTEFLAVHAWLATYLTSQGLRVLVLNGETAPTPDKRGAIAERFNSGEVDVLIGNRVMAEGINVQRHGCSVHHLGTPWSPADLHQRNGRVVRQFSGSDVAYVYYYVAKGGADLLMLQAVDGKAGWLQTIIGAGSDTTNPAATGEADPYELLAAASRRPAVWKAAAEERRRKKRDALRLARKRETVQQANAYLELVATCGARRELCLQEAERVLEKLDAKTIDLDRLRSAGAEGGGWVTPEGVVWWPGSWATWSEDGEDKRVQVGRRRNDEVGVRAAGEQFWTVTRVDALDDLEKAAPLVFPGPEDDQPLPEGVLLSSPRLYGGKALNWQWAPEAWLRRAWKPEVVLAAARAGPHRVSHRLPFVSQGRIVNMPLNDPNLRPEAILPIWEAAAWRASPAVLDGAAGAIAESYFGIDLPGMVDRAVPFVLQVLFAWDGQPVSLAQALGVRLDDAFGWALKSQFAERLALVPDALRVLRDTRPQTGRGLADGEVSPIAGTRVAGSTLVLQGQEQVVPLGASAGATLDDIMRRAAYGTTIGAWWPIEGRMFRSDGLSVVVVRDPTTGTLVALLQRSPKPDLEARHQLFAARAVSRVSDAAAALQSVAVPVDLKPELAAARVSPRHIADAVASMDALRRAPALTIEVLDGIGSPDLEYYRELWVSREVMVGKAAPWTQRVQVPVTWQGLPPPARRYDFPATGLMQLLAAAEGRETVTLRIGPATMTIGEVTIGADVEAVGAWTWSEVEFPFQWRELPRSPRLELHAEGLVVRQVDAELRWFFRHRTDFVPLTTSYLSGEAPTDQLYGPVRVALGRSADGRLSFRLADERMNLSGRVAQVEPTSWPAEPTAWHTVEWRSLFRALSGLGKKASAVIRARAGQVTVEDAGDESSRVQIDADGTTTWQIGVRHPKQLVRALREHEGLQTVDVAVTDRQLWMRLGRAELFV